MHLDARGSRVSQFPVFGAIGNRATFDLGRWARAPCAVMRVHQQNNPAHRSRKPRPRENLRPRRASTERMVSHGASLAVRRTWIGALSVAVCLLRLPGVAAAAPSSEPESGVSSPKDLYDEGRKAYRVGDFATAVAKWERAYELSDNGLLLYNISLAYEGLHSLTGDIGDLRRARAVLENFLRVAENDPSIDADDAPTRVAALDEMLTDAERESPSSAAAPQPAEIQPQRGGKSVDLGRRLRLAGIGTMISGGGFVVAGGGLAAFFGSRGREFESRLRSSLGEQAAAGCRGGSVTASCVQIGQEVATWRDNGNHANRLSVALGIGFAGTGAVALVAGGLLFNEGNKRTKHWGRDARAIMFAPSARGVFVSGSF